MATLVALREHLEKVGFSRESDKPYTKDERTAKKFEVWAKDDGKTVYADRS